MQIQVRRLVLTLILPVGLAALVSGCASAGKKEADTRVTAEQLSEPARATMNRVTAGGQVDKINREVERGKVVYDVEATVGGRHLEFLIADADGAVLGTEVPVEFSELPEPVRVAAVKYFGSPDGLKAMKGVEYGETSYEIEGMKKGKTAEVNFDSNGKRED